MWHQLNPKLTHHAEGHWSGTCSHDAACRPWSYRIRCPYPAKRNVVAVSSSQATNEGHLLQHRVYNTRPHPQLSSSLTEGLAGQTIPAAVPRSVRKVVADGPPEPLLVLRVKPDRLKSSCILAREGQICRFCQLNRTNLQFETTWRRP